MLAIGTMALRVEDFDGSNQGTETGERLLKEQEMQSSMDDRKCCSGLMPGPNRSTPMRELETQGLGLETR